MSKKIGKSVLSGKPPKSDDELKLDELTEEEREALLEKIREYKKFTLKGKEEAIKSDKDFELGAQDKDHDIDLTLKIKQKPKKVKKVERAELEGEVSDL